MKIIFLTKFKVLALLVVMCFSVCATATAQQYSYKYVGKFQAEKPEVPLNDGNWNEVDWDISTNNCPECMEKYGELFDNGTWKCLQYAIPGDVNYYCFTSHTGSGTSEYFNQLFGGQTSRYLHNYKAKELGNTQYAMEVTGIAIYTAGIYTGPDGASMNNPVTQLQHGGMLWRQVPKETVAATWPFADASSTTFATSQMENWLGANVTPVYQVLVDKDKPWDLSSIPFIGRQSTNMINARQGHVWLDMPLEKPVIFNADSNVEIAFLQNYYFNEISGFRYNDPDGDNSTVFKAPGFDNLTSTVLCSYSPFGGARCTYSQSKPHLRLRYRYLSCENIKTWTTKTVYKRDEGAITPDNINVSFNMDYAPAGSTHNVTYAIVGPYPYTDTVYRTTTPITVTDADKDENNLYTSSLGSFPDIMATGTAVAEDGRSFDGMLVEPGSYTLIAIVHTQLDGFLPVETKFEFGVSAGMDLSAREIVEPQHLQVYSVDHTAPVNVVATVVHNGVPEDAPIGEFYVQANLYSGNYNAVTGVFTRTGNPIATLPAAGGAYHWTADKDNNGAFLQPQEAVEIFPAQWGSGFSVRGRTPAYHEVEFKVWTADESADLFITNNVYPRGGRNHVIRLQKDFDVTINTAQVLPGAAASYYLGQTVYVQTGIQNRGIMDLSEKAGYSLRTTIHRRVGNVDGAAVWAPEPYLVRRASDGEGFVTIPSVDNETLAPIGWLVSEAGTFNAVSELLYNGEPMVPAQRASRVFTVYNGLSGTIPVTQNSASYKTIKSAVDALYRFGVSGDVIFELQDAEYTESSWEALHPDFPALDFRGKISGVCDTVDGVARIRTITFKPGGARAQQKGSIRINLESKSGYGMMFGNANDAVAHPNSLFNEAQTYDKQTWYKSDGYITWDGGANKSFVISLKAPASGILAGDPINYFRAPIYLSNAKNITIANCIIEENDEALARSEHFLLPGNSYNGAQLEWNSDYVVTAGHGYSAGIVLRSVPPYQTEYQGNFYNLLAYPCIDNTISGNEISSFSYGIASIGLDYRSDIPEYIINIVDTVRNITLQDLGNTARYADCNKRIEYANVPAGGNTTITWYREQVPSIARGIRYYKHHLVRLSNGLTSEFVQVLDSATGGAARAFNRNTLIENNLIHDIGRAGIFLGNDENTVIRNNTITGITGELVAPDGSRILDAEVAGILLGGNQRTYITETAQSHGSMVVGTEIYRNEISKLAGGGAINGIKLEQVPVTERVSSFQVKFPDRPERLKIYSNIIWDFQPTATTTSRYGINLSLGKKLATIAEDITETDKMYYATADATHFIDNILIANNTIVLNEDGSDASEGNYFGLRLQRIKNARILNNAIELEDATHYFASTNASTFASMVYYQGPKPSDINNTIDYNAYGYTQEGDVDAYCHVLTDMFGNLIDIAHRGEYQTLTNWQNWIGTDLYSVARSFSSDLEATEEDYPRLRFQTNPVPQGSVLDKRGTFVAEAIVDIDGVDRINTDKNLDIGAQYVNSTKLARDMEVLSIIAPATYKSTVGPWADAEYFMINDAPITVKALVRNNGSTALQNEKIVLNVYREAAASNTAVANTLTTAHNTTFYNNERGLYNTKYTFLDIQPVGAVFFTSTDTVSLRVGESTEVEFQLNKTFDTYYSIGSYTVPIHFTAMRPNITPRYLFAVTTNMKEDMDPSNNTVSKHARFYIKKSRNDMLVSAVNSYHSTLVQENGAYVPNSTLSNTDWIAGKLNLDTLQQGFVRLDLYQQDAEANEFDYDVIDRHAWDYRNIDYTLYKTLYVIDELEKNQSRWTANRYDNTLRLFREQWYAQDLVDFLTSSKASSKKNLIIASENFVSDIHTSLLQTSQLNILSGKLQRDTFLVNDGRRLAFLNNGLQVASLRDSLNKVLVRDYLRADVVYDSLSDNGPYTWNSNTYNYEYMPVSPLYNKAFTEGDATTAAKWNFVPQEYKFVGKTGSITGNSLNLAHVFEIKSTGWYWNKGGTLVEDASPFGTVFRPIDNILGNFSVGAVYDTVSNNPGLSYNPQTGKVAALCASTIENNIVLLGFDWRHFANIEVLLSSISDYILRNGGGGTMDDNPLPISFYGFEANAISNRVELEWNTTSGTVISSFDLERASVIDNKIGDFRHLETVPAQANTSDNSYNTTDRNLEFGSTLAYRLKMTDATGNFVYTDSKIVNIEQAQFFISDIAPNPVSSTSEFTITNNAEQNLYIAIYDLSGKEMLVLNNGMLASGTYKFEIDSKNLPQSAYTLTIRNSKQTLNKQFSVVK